MTGVADMQREALSEVGHKVERTVVEWVGSEYATIVIHSEDCVLCWLGYEPWEEWE